jgi:hypothetical protein
MSLSNPADHYFLGNPVVPALQLAYSWGCCSILPADLLDPAVVVDLLIVSILLF